MGFVAAAAAIALFAALASAVKAGLTQSLDNSVLQFMASHRTKELDQVMVEITTLGTGVVVIMIVVVASIFLWQTQHRWSAAVLLIGTVGGLLMDWLLKAFFQRPRPEIFPHGTMVYSSSFPSGHAMTALIAYGTVAYLIGRLQASPTMKRTTWGIAVLLVLGIGFSRMYLGVHYPSDILGGYIAGLAWLTFVASLVTAVGFFSDRRPETHVEERDLDK